MPRVENETDDQPEELEVVEVAPGDFRRLNAADRKAMAEQIKATAKGASRNTGEVPSTAVEEPMTPEADVPTPEAGEPAATPRRSR